MDIEFEVFTGIGLSIEFIEKDLDLDLEESVIIIEVLCFRWMIWLGDL